MSTEKRFLIGGEWRSSNQVDAVVFPYTGETIAEVYQAAESDMEDAIASAQKGFEVIRKLPSHVRSGILKKFAEQMASRSTELINAMVLEGGKTVKVARGELARAIQTISVASEEARRIGGEILPLDWTPAGEDHLGIVRRVPVGPVLGIAPFNYPVNLGCHKVGPAIAAGNSIVLKPAEDTPLSSLLLAEMLLEAGCPPEAFSVVTAEGPRAEPMARDDRFKYLTFTGSSQVGWHLKQIAGRKRVGLELGGNAGIIVHDDANIDYAVDRCVFGAFTNSGQNCISVQRVIVQERIFEDFAHQMIQKTQALRVGDPREESTDVGPLIRMIDAERIESWLKEAVGQGARIETGGRRDGIMVEPTVLTNVAPDMKVSCQEVFGPVVSLIPYRDFDDAIRIVNATDYGLQGGLFTQDIHRIMRAFDEIEVGGLQINEVSTFRVDHMPYGGVKSSGLGREGVRYAIEEMTDIKLLVLNLAGGAALRS